MKGKEKVKTEKGNILDIQEGLVCHQVNCQGKMGAGLAKGIRKKYPKVYKEYMKQYNEGRLKLGNIMVIPVSPRLSIINIASQDRYGRDRRYTDYKALRNCLKELKKFINKWDIKKVYFPYKMGCNLGGGDWNIVESMIEKHIPNAIIMKR